jgi:formylmethanofuran dehydrogenase subunit E
MNRWKRIEQDKDKLLEKAIDIHGHIGPFLILGMIMGNEAIKRLGAEGYHDLSVEIYCGFKTPLTAIADGVEATTGLTIGKMNLKMQEGDSGKAIFTTKSGKKLTLVPKREILILSGKIKKEQEKEISENFWYNTEPDDLIKEI